MFPDSYNLNNVLLTIGGIALSGFGETDAIAFEWSEDLVQVSTTADGRTIYSMNNARGVFANLTLVPTSRAYTLIYGLLDTQHGLTTGIRPPQLPPLPFYLSDLGNGDVVSAPYTVFVQRPVPSKAKRFTEQVFRVHLSTPRVVAGALNVI